MCEFISQSSTYVSWSSPLSMTLINLRRVSWDRIEAYAEKENIISSKRERNFLRNFFVICEFLPQSYCWVLRKQFANTLVVDSAKWYLGALGGNREKGNILRSKLERSLLRNCISMCECKSQSYTFLFSVHFANTVFRKSAMGYLWTQWSLRRQRIYPQMKTRTKLC